MDNKCLTVYLDLNKWIDLAKSYHDRPDGKRFLCALNAAQRAVVSGAARFPLCGQHLIEFHKARGARRRQRLAPVFLELSRGVTMAPAHQVLDAQLKTAAANVLEVSHQAPTTRVFGEGLLFAFGMSDKDFPHISRFPRELLGEHLQRGDPLMDEGIRRYRSGLEDWAARRQKAMDRGRAYHEDVRKRAYLAQLTYDLQGRIDAAMRDLGSSLEERLALGPEHLAAFFSKVPCLDVEIELTLEREQQWTKPLTGNDLDDIAALRMAIPHCDIVVTESFWVALTTRRMLDRKYNTRMLSDVADLADYLAG